MSKLSDEDLKILQYAKHIQNYCVNQKRCSNCVFYSGSKDKSTCILQKAADDIIPQAWPLDKVDVE